MRVKRFRLLDKYFYEGVVTLPEGTQRSYENHAVLPTVGLEINNHGLSLSFDYLAYRAQMSWSDPLYAAQDMSFRIILRGVV